MVNPDLYADCHASGTVRIVAWAANERTEIGLCGHCLNRHRSRLEADGWLIIPFGAVNTTPGVGTESTGQHFALDKG